MNYYKCLREFLQNNYNYCCHLECLALTMYNDSECYEVSGNYVCRYISSRNKQQPLLYLPRHRQLNNNFERSAFVHIPVSARLHRVSVRGDIEVYLSMKDNWRFSLCRLFNTGKRTNSAAWRLHSSYVTCKLPLKY